MKDKKGISPLIATVLIIGFTIVLAALVIQWGGDLFKGFQEETGKSAEVSMACSNLLTGVDVSTPKGGIDLYSAGGVASVLIDNNNPNQIDLVGYKLKVYDAIGNAYLSEEEEFLIAAGEAKVVSANVDTGISDGDGGMLPIDGAEKVAVFGYIKTKSGEMQMCSQELGTIEI